MTVMAVMHTSGSSQCLIARWGARAPRHLAGVLRSGLDPVQALTRVTAPKSVRRRTRNRHSFPISKGCRVTRRYGGRYRYARCPMQTVLKRLGSWRPVQVLMAYGASQGGNYAAGLSYNAFLAMFPLILGILSIIGFAVKDPGVQKTLYTGIVSVFPSDAHAQICLLYTSPSPRD